MTIVVETGAGVLAANSYVTTAFIDSYLAARGRSEENNWIGQGIGDKQVAAIKATDYIENSSGPKFKGTREFNFVEALATASVQFSALPNDGETLTLGDEVYTMRTALSSPAVADEVLIGATGDDTASNLDDALRAVAENLGVTFSTGTSGSRHVTSSHEIATQLVKLTATANGASGNDTTIANTLTGPVVSTAFTGGLDGGSQPLSFPQLGLVDSAGRTVLGIPRKLKEATAEYAVRSLAAELAPDPAVDEQGGSIKLLREKVGPLETETEYVEGTNLNITLRPYPAADKLLQDYVRSGGVAVR